MQRGSAGWKPGVGYSHEPGSESEIFPAFGGNRV